MAFFVITLSDLPSTQAQFSKKNKENQAITDIDTLSSDWEFNIYHFPNVNKITTYYNKSEIQKIRKLESDNNWEELYPLLKNYVKKF